MKMFLLYLRYLLQKHRVGIVLVVWVASILTLYFISAGIVISAGSFLQVRELVKNLMATLFLLLVIPILTFVGYHGPRAFRNWISHQVWVYELWKEKQSEKMS